MSFIHFIAVKEFDPRAFAEEVDIVPKMAKDFYSNLKSSKWKERKEVLDDLQTLVKATPRIKDSPDMGELVKSLATCIHKDVNVNCVMVAASCLEELVRGLSSAFAKHRESLVPPMLERLKERKANITDAIGDALDAIFETVLVSFLSVILPVFTYLRRRSLNYSRISYLPCQTRILK